MLAVSDVLFASLSRPGCADRSLVTMHVSIVSSGPS
jgi:hypothetical protein